jgi:hypothetical protein
MTTGASCRTPRPAGAAVCPAWSRWPEAIRLFAHGVTLRPCVPVAVVVGIVLSAANEGPLLAAGDLAWQDWIRVAVNFMVPFLVASHGFLRGGRAAPAGQRPPGGTDHVQPQP